jgi:hypothetical protein
MRLHCCLTTMVVTAYRFTATRLDSWILNISWSHVRITDCEVQSIVEARGVLFSVLQVNKTGRCMLQSWVRCGRLPPTVVRQLWNAVLECRIAHELLSCHRMTVQCGTALVCLELWTELNCTCEYLRVIDPSWIESASNGLYLLQYVTFHLRLGLPSCHSLKFPNYSIWYLCTL